MLAACTLALHQPLAAQQPPRGGAAGRQAAAAVPRAGSRQLAQSQARSQCTRVGRQLVVAAAAEQQAGSGEAVRGALPIPRGPQEMVQQCVAAVTRGWEAGIKRQRIDLLLPLIGATDLDDWPGGIRQQFKAAQPMVEEVLRAVKQLPGLEGPLSARLLDDGDAVAAWEGPRLAAVLFPTAETLGEVKKIAEARKDGLVLLISPQWVAQGNVVSDLGFLPWARKANEDFLASFDETYILKQLRMSSDDVRLIKSYPSPWQVNLARPDAPSQPSEFVAQRAERPAYKELEVILRAVPWSMTAKPIGERLAYEAQFVRASLDSLPQQQKLRDGGE